MGSLAAAHEKHAAPLPPTSPETRVLSTLGSSLCLHASTRRFTSPAAPIHTPRTRIGMLHTARDVTTLGICTLDPPTHPSFAKF
jgi:hypothetical protein